MSKNDTTFRDWINKHGSPKLARLLNTTPSSVRHWRLGKTLPRACQMKRIKELTRGRVGYKQIIEGSCSPLSK